MAEAVKNIRIETRAETRRQADLSRFVVQDKENFSVYTDVSVEPAQRSPLPVGYPRIPLQDITDVLQPINRMNDDGDEDVRKKKSKPKGRKKVTRPCPILVEVEASTSSQIPASHPGTETETDTVKCEVTHSILTSSKSRIETQGKKTVRFAATEASGEVALVAAESVEVKTVLRGPGSEVEPAVSPASPRNQKPKRRKTPAKSVAGRNVARFR